MSTKASISTFLSVRLENEAKAMDRLCARYPLDMETFWALKDAAKLLRASAKRQAEQAAQAIHAARG